jgi:hypothetical protein
MRYILVLGALLASSWLLSAAPAQARHASVNVVVEPVAALETSNEAVAAVSYEAVATVTSLSDGTPIPGAHLTLTTLAEFGGERGFVVLARAVTDMDGAAILRFEARLAGERELRLEYRLHEAEQPEITSVTLQFDPIDEQLYSSGGGFGIFQSEWIIIGVVSTIWVVLFLIALGVADIARAGTVVSPEDLDAEGGEKAQA